MNARNGGNRPRVIGYARVSTQEQAQEGISLDAQSARLTAYAAAHELDLVRIETDAGVSGKKTSNRPALQRALAALKASDADGLVIVKLDRLSRTTRDILDLVSQAEREGWAFHSLQEHLDTTTPAGKFTLTILGALAQLEREQVAERTRGAMAELRRQGRKTGSKPPFGYRHDGGRVVPDDDERPILERIRELRREGAGAYKIMGVLNREGVVNPRTADVWRLGTVQSILRTMARATTSSS